MEDELTLADYRKLKLIGEGGFSYVYLAVHEYLYDEQAVAIKVPKIAQTAKEAKIIRDLHY